MSERSGGCGTLRSAQRTCGGLSPFVVLALTVLFGVAAPALADKSGVKPSVLSLPSGPGSIEGLGESFEPQLNTGSAPYSVKLAIPPGVVGHQPEFTLRYNSGSGNGPFGVGWSLSLPYIQRQTDKGQPTYTAGDTFLFSNGEELVPLADGTFRCENESDFMRFERVVDGWEVKDRSGKTYRFGQYPDVSDPIRTSRVGKGGTSFDQTFKWYVTSFEDTNGNRIEYFYDSQGDPGILYPAEIRYNLNGPNYNSVAFTYEPRTDSFSDYRSGFKIQTGRRALRITISSRGSRVREYHLSYDPSGVESLDPTAEGAVPLTLSTLTKITQFDSSPTNQNFLPPLRLGYTRLHLKDRDNAPTGNFPGPEDVDLNANGLEDGPGVRQLVSPPLNLNFQDGNAEFLDVDGDALPDIIHTDGSTGSHYYYRNLGDNSFDARATIPSSPFVFLASPGATLADLDGDGRSDLVNKSSSSQLVVYRNRGDGSWAPGSSATNPPLFGLTDPDVRLVDMNFDKRVDVVRSISGSAWQICLNGDDADTDHPPFENFPSPEDVDHDSDGVVNGGTWQCSGSVPMPFTPQVVFSNASVRLADMNGDRLQDVLWIRQISATETVVWYWPNMGADGFDAYIVMAGSVDTGPVSIDTLKVFDVNGDGLSDLIHVASGKVTAWINLGGDQWGTAESFTGTPTFDAASTALRFADLNGNGSSDLVWIKAVGPTSERFQYLDFVSQTKPNQLKIVDNGLGKRIEIQYRSSTGYAVEAGQGGNPWQLQSPVATQVVSRVTTTPGLELDGNPGDPDEHITDFAYRDAYYDAYEKEFRGFAFAKKFDRGDVDAPTLVTRMFFHTGAPDGVDNDGDGAIDERTAKGGVEEESLKGRALKLETTAAATGADSVLGDGQDAPDSDTYDRTENDWRIRQIYDPGGGSQGVATLDERDVSFAFVEVTRDHVIERQAGTAHTHLAAFAFDDFGNRTGEWKFGSLAISGDERVTTSSFVNDTTRWIVDRPCQVTVKSLTGTKATETRSYYDGPDFLGLSLCTVGDEGNLKRREAWVEDSTYVDEVRHAHGPFGNVISTYDPEGVVGVDKHRVDTVWDSTFHAFPVQETLHVGDGRPALVMDASYDLGFGTMTQSIDFNGNATDYQYDSFGRLVGVVKPGDSGALPTTVYEYRLSDPVRDELYEYDAAGALSVVPTLDSASSVTTRRREAAGLTGTFDVIQYIDGLGRSLASVKEGEAGFVVAEAVLFNDRATVRDTFQPYRRNVATWSPPDSGCNPGSPEYPDPCPRTVTRYDEINREIERENPPDSAGTPSSVTISYSPLQRSVFDENSNEMIYLDDGLGRLIEVQETNLADRYITGYDYNPADSLLQITDAQSNAKVFVYDGLQRKTFMNDPDRGHMTYDYDDASNLVRTVDAKAQQIDYTYDGVNRLLTEDYLDTTGLTPDVAYTYDVPAGAVDLGDGSTALPQNTAGFLTGVSDLAGEEHTSYDARGRPVWAVRRLRNPATGALMSFKAERTYDSLDRVVDLIYADNDRVTHLYNARSLLDQITGGPNGTILTDVDYRASGQLERCEYGNGVATDYDYDSRVRITALDTFPIASPAEPLISYGYAFDLASNITRIDDLRPAAVPEGDSRRNTQSFAYDDLYRLLDVQYSFNLPAGSTRDDGSINYVYDKIGNMLSKTSTLAHLENGVPITDLGPMAYGGAAGPATRIGRNPGDPPGPHALSSVGSGPGQRFLAYDDNGNVTTLDARTLTWDVKDRLVAVEDSTMRADYTYDYTDRRVIKRVIPKATPQRPNPAPPETVLYPDRHFEVREGEQPLKYVFNGEMRVARTTGSLDATRLRVQRFSIAAGWNVLAFAVQAGDAASQLGIGTDPLLSDAFRWDDPAGTWVTISGATSLPAGSIVALFSSAGTSLEVLGSYTVPTSGPIAGGSGFVPVPGLDVLVLDQALPPEVEYAWVFDAEKQIWREYLTGALAAFSSAPDFASVGGAIYVRATGASQLRLPDVATGIRYYHQDHLGSSNVVADGNGDLVEEVAFYPFGHPRNEYRPGVSGAEPYKFTQKERDAESGLQYFEARYLTGALGRFASVDPYPIVLEAISPLKGDREHVEAREHHLMIPQQLNPYSYVGNRPLRFVDPTGLQQNQSYIFDPASAETWGPPVAGPLVTRTEGGQVHPQEFGTFGPTPTRYAGRHQGYDLLAREGTPVLSRSGGVVVYAGYNSSDPAGAGSGTGLGWTVVVQDEGGRGLYHTYSHLGNEASSSISVVQGQTVRRGDQLGQVGRSGNAATLPANQTHLHYELRVQPIAGGGLRNRIDPGQTMRTTPQRASPAP